MLQGVLVESVPCPAPEELRPEYTKPMVLEGEVLRTLTLDREGEFFQWNMPVDGKRNQNFPGFRYEKPRHLDPRPECNEETGGGSGELRQVGSGRHETHWTG